MADERQQLEAWRAGDQAAGAALFELYFEAVYRFFARKIDGDVDDLVQRTFLGSVEGRARIEGTFRAYLYGVARHVLHERLREVAKNQALDFGVSSLADVGPSPSTAARVAEARHRVQEALASVPLDLAIAIELHYWEGLRGPEIAQVLGVPEGTVRSRLRRALGILRETLAALGRDETTSAALGEVDRWREQL